MENFSIDFYSPNLCCKLVIFLYLIFRKVMNFLVLQIYHSITDRNNFKNNIWWSFCEKYIKFRGIFRAQTVIKFLQKKHEWLYQYIFDFRCLRNTYGLKFCFWWNFHDKMLKSCKNISKNHFLSKIEVTLHSKKKLYKFSSIFLFYIWKVF